MTLDPSTATTEFPKLERYQVLRKLGEGGMGTVYLALDSQLDRHVALKVLPDHSVNNPDSVGRFQREARALAKLSHPGIVQAFDCGSHASRQFLVMEFVEGQSLADVIAEKSALSAARAADYVHQAALALQHAHEKGLIHRDLKSGNLLVTPRGQVKILDLGLARFLQDQIGDAGKTREGVGMGTPDYAAPEQFRDAHSADPRADIYSLGCTLYHLLAGKVPYPGSSLAEKYDAHAVKEPPALEEVCPDVPIGLAVVVRKMMAKKPADRYQTAQEVANALTPFVGGSSLSFGHLKETQTWHAGQLTLNELQPPRRRFGMWALAGCVALVLLVVGVWTGAKLLGPAPEIVAANGTKPDDKDKGQPAEESKKNEWIDPNALTVSKDKKDGGVYRTINDALEKVKPGQTIRVVDGEVYEEKLRFDDPARLSGVTVEAARRATIQTSSEGSLVTLDKVADLTVRGFRLRAISGAKITLVQVSDACPGLLLDDLIFESRGATYSAIEMASARGDGPSSRPMVIQNCSINNAQLGMFLFGLAGGGPGYQVPRPLAGVCIRGNRFKGCAQAVFALGTLRQCQIVGNEFADSNRAAIQLQNLQAGSEGILIANNTVFQSLIAFRLWDDSVRGKNVQVRNNLMIAPQLPTDMVFVVSSSFNEPPPLQAGDGSKIATAWQMDHNWREGAPPAKTDEIYSQSWIPPGPKDVLQAKIDVLSRDVANADYLRPAKDSPLAMKGAGNEEPSLPSYVGAVPPEGVESWDWDRTWLAWPGTTKLLTVSKDEKDGSTYRTINAALDKAKPWDTIRVLDTGTYEETIAVTDEEKHLGLCLEAVQGATLHLPARTRIGVQIRGVSHVRLIGFRLTQARDRAEQPQTMVHVTERTSGVMLSRLHIETRDPTYCVAVENAGGGPGEPPVVIRGCQFRCGPDGASVGIQVTRQAGAKPRQGIRIVENDMLGMLEGVNLQHEVIDVQVVGNRILRSTQSAVELQDLQPGAKRILIANNTVIEGAALLKVIDNKPYPVHGMGQVETANNIFLNADITDWLFAEALERVPGTQNQYQTQPGDATALVKKWSFHHNWRDLSGRDRTHAFPPTPLDHDYSAADLLSIDVNKADRLRPRKESAAAREGAGVVDPSLPVYVGALPPDGVAPWDWDRTWRARAPKKPEGGAAK